MIHKIISFVLFVCLFVACAADIKRDTPKENSKTLKTPFLLHKASYTKALYAQKDAMSDIQFKYCGKYTMADTIDLQSDNTQDDDYTVIDPRDTILTDSFAIFVDYNTNLNHKFIIEDNKPDIYHYPVYVVNTSSSSKYFELKGQRVIGIQEALDTTDNHWYPIDYKAPEFCEIRRLAIKVKPAECVIFAVPKYEGDQKGPMRLRFQTDKQIYISQPFIGNYNRAQFKLPTDKQKFSSEEYIMDCFLGATPKGY